MSRFRRPVYTAFRRAGGLEIKMVTPLTFTRGDSALIDALRAGHPGAAAAFYDQNAAHVRRTLRSVVGLDADLPDLLQEVFIRAIDRIGELKDLNEVGSWLTTIAIFTARAHIRRQVRRRWLYLFSPDQTRSQHREQPSSDARRALTEVYEVLNRMSANDRIAFALRFIDGLTLPDGAAAAQTSLATFKRRLVRAEKRFLILARSRPSLAQWIEEGTRWSLRNQI
jgi:RNA polymerase sigma-70 factor, ECF subfamily